MITERHCNLKAVRRASRPPH